MSDPNTSSSAGSAGFEPAFPTPAAEQPASWWEDFIDIFYTPSTVFARRANAGFGVPMLVVTILFGVIFIAMSGALQPLMDAEFQRGAAATMKNNPQVTAEMMEKGRAIGETAAKFGTFIVIPVTLFLLGLILWIVGKLVDAKVSLSQAVLIVSLAWTPRVLEAVVNGVQGLLLDPASLNGRYRVTFGVGRFFDPDVASPMLIAMVGRIDLFTIWITVLMAIGLSVIGKIPRSRAALAAAAVWVIGALPGILQAARAQ
jgi:hypothetical protein